MREVGVKVHIRVAIVREMQFLQAEKVKKNTLLKVEEVLRTKV